MKTFVLPEDNFKTAPLVIYDCTYAHMRKYLQRKFGIEFDDSKAGCIGTMLTFDRAPWRVVWVYRLRPGYRDDFACLAHELFHLVTRVMADKGVPLVSHHPNGECGDEAAAYLYEYYLAHCLDALGWMKKKDPA